MNMTPHQPNSPIRNRFLRNGIATLLAFTLTWQFGCQHNLAPKPSIPSMHAMPEANANGEPTARQIFPTSTMQASNGRQPPHAGGRGAGGPGAGGTGSCGTVGCGGACCQSQAYRPKFPEFNDPSVVPANCQTAPFNENFACPLPYPPRHVDPQEYVYDGGDRDPQARLREDLTVVGLDSEDTVIRFETQSGAVELQSGCRVPIYAPRFASTRKITPLGYSDRVVGTQAALRDQQVSRVAEALSPTNVRLSNGPQREENVKVVEAVRERNRGVQVDKVIPAIGISDAFKPYEDLALIRKGTLTTDETIKLRRSTAAALSWSNVEELVVLVDNVEVRLVQENNQPEEVLTYELEGKPRVRLCKVASHQVAAPGDVIDFTIRFDNVGDQKITNIVVHDSLAPRLEYVEDSQKSSLKSDFTSKANDAGSAVLTWTVLETIRAGEGGFIRFQCKVR